MSDRITELRVSARGWHGVQLAVIGFIGLCGVLQGGRPDNPMLAPGLRRDPGLGRSRHRLPRDVPRRARRLAAVRSRSATDDAAELERDGRRLKQGLVLTFVALALLALGTASGWWPQDEGGGDIAVQATSGERWCGSLADAGPGAELDNLRAIALQLGTQIGFGTQSTAESPPHRAARQ